MASSLNHPPRKHNHETHCPTAYSVPAQRVINHSENTILIEALCKSFTGSSKASTHLRAVEEPARRPAGPVGAVIVGSGQPGADPHRQPLGGGGRRDRPGEDGHQDRLAVGSLQNIRRWIDESIAWDGHLCLFTLKCGCSIGE